MKKPGAAASRDNLISLIAAAPGQKLLCFRTYWTLWYSRLLHCAAGWADFQSKLTPSAQVTCIVIPISVGVKRRIKFFRERMPTS